ncbi:MAG: protein-disulfide reductase DsbD domain-containing protein [Algibacter sp.]
MNLNKLLLIFSLLFFSMQISAQILEPAKWEQKLSKNQIAKGDVVELIFQVKLNDTWHLYSNRQDYQIGPLKTEFKFEPNDSYQLVGEVKAMGAKKEYDKVFEVDVNYFEHTAEFRQKVKILSKKPIIKGYYEYQVCSTVDGKCILGEGEFDITLEL